MAGDAHTRRPFEDGIDVTGLAWLQAVRTGQFISGRQVVELASGTLCKGGAAEQSQQQEAVRE